MQVSDSALGLVNGNLMYIPNGAGYVLVIAVVKRALLDDVLIVLTVEHHWPTVRMGVALSRLATMGGGLYVGVLCPELNVTSLDVSISLLFTSDHNQLVKYADPTGGSYRANCILTHAATGYNVTLACADVLRYTINGSSLQPGGGSRQRCPAPTPDRHAQPHSVTLTGILRGLLWL